MLTIYTNKWNQAGRGSMMPGVVVPIITVPEIKHEQVSLSTITHTLKNVTPHQKNFNEVY